MSCNNCEKKDCSAPGAATTKDIEDSPTFFHFAPVFRSEHPVSVQWKKMPYDKPVEVVSFQGRDILVVNREVLHQLAYDAMCDIQHYFRSDHLQYLRNILDDVDASSNDKFVAMSLLKNACISAGRVLPSCQDTGTAIIHGKKGECVMTGCNDDEEFSRGVFKAYTQHNYRYSQMAPLDMFSEVNTKCNLPAQVDIQSVQGDEYKLMFIAKGGGSANKSFLYQKTKAVLTPKALVAFLSERIHDFGTAACPPYHIAVVIGGLSAEQTLKTVKLASTRYYDDLPRKGDGKGGAFRDIEWEEKVLQLTRECGIGAQFGGRYFCHQVRVIRLPRHGASCPVGLGVSCSADRQILAKINRTGVFLEELVTDPAQYLPEALPPAGPSENVVEVDLNLGMVRLRKILSEYPIKTRLSLTGTMIVARDLAHSKLAQELDAGQPLPQYFKDHVIYYAGPAKTPAGHASGSFGPTTAGRMDVYLSQFMAAGGSYVSLAKGNRSQEVTDSCRRYRGFYLGSIGGQAALLATENIKKVELLAFPELGMEAIYKIEVENFPAFMVVDDKGNDFFK